MFPAELPEVIIKLHLEAAVIPDYRRRQQEDHKYLSYQAFSDHVCCEIYVFVYVAALLFNMSPVKRICVFEHSAMTNFNCACPAIQRG